MPQNRPLLRKWWFLIVSTLVLLSIFAATFLYFRARHSEETIHQLITRTLAEGLRGDVTLGAIRVQLIRCSSGED
jgi:hypothetical protein